MGQGCDNNEVLPVQCVELCGPLAMTLLQGRLRLSSRTPVNRTREKRRKTLRTITADTET